MAEELERFKMNQGMKRRGLSKKKKKSKAKVKQLYLTSITRNSNPTDKPEVDGALILLS